MATTKRRTAADIAAAVALGALDPSTEIATAEEAAAERTERTIIRPSDGVAIEVPNGTDHECAIPGCRHGASHGPTQPDRQVKLEAPCGAVARMTVTALHRAGGTINCGHGDPFTVAARRVYNRKP